MTEPRWVVARMGYGWNRLPVPDWARKFVLTDYNGYMKVDLTK